MQIVDAALATVEQARAYQVEDVLLVRVSGTKPTGCHVVTIEQSLLDVEPPEFLVRLSSDPRVRCMAQSTPFEEQRGFRIGTLRPEIIVHHAGGAFTVDVQDVTPEPNDVSAARAARVGGSIFEVDGDPHEALGRSANYDFGEAMRDAIKQLPAQGAGIPDWLSYYTVVSIRAEIGGIAGVNDLTVRVAG